MVTEDGSIKTARISVAPALNMYRKKLKTVSLISLIIGALGVIMYIVGAFFDTEDGGSPLWVDIFLVFAVPLALGLIGDITLIRLNRREQKEMPASECIFYADCFFYNCKTAFQSEETQEKFTYTDAAIKRENDKYGYVFVTGKGAFLVFGKEGLEERELNTIRKLFNSPVPDGETVELKKYDSNEEKISI